MNKLRYWFRSLVRRDVSVAPTRERAIEAFRLLNDFIGDLVGATKGMEFFDHLKIKAGANPEVIRIYNKMALSFLFLTLAKWLEFSDRYEKVIPPEMYGICDELRRELESRGVREFRNKIVGHIWSRKLQRPLLPQEIEILERKMTKGATETFYQWINHPQNNSFGVTVVGTIEGLRDGISKKWTLSKSELFPN